MDATLGPLRARQAREDILCYPQGLSRFSINHQQKNGLQIASRLIWRPLGESNPCYRRERAVS